MKKHKYREEIQKRTINPSSDSWDKLAAKLDAVEQDGQRKKWPFLKIASVILVLISIGFYFYQPEDNSKELREIVSPSNKEEILKNPQFSKEIETEVAATPEKPASLPFDETETSKEVIEGKQIAQRQVATTKSIPEINTNPESNTNLVPVQDTIINSTLIADNKDIEEAVMDDEIDQLLHESKIKLIYNGEITSKKLVNSNALLNSVEDDLDKSLKERLIEKITTTLKKDKEVATSKQN